MGRVVLIILIGAFVVFGTFTIVSLQSTKHAETVAIENYKTNYVRNISLSTIDILMSKLADSSNYRVPQQQQMSLLNGVARYTIKDTILGTDSVIQIRVIAKYGNINKETIAYVKITGGFVPPTLRGVITANANLNKQLAI